MTGHAHRSNAAHKALHIAGQTSASHPCHSPAAEYVPRQVECGDGCVEEVEGEEYKHPVLDDTRNVHRQRTRLAYQQEHSLWGAALKEGGRGWTWWKQVVEGCGRNRGHQLSVPNKTNVLAALPCQLLLNQPTRHQIACMCARDKPPRTHQVECKCCECVSQQHWSIQGDLGGCPCCNNAGVLHRRCWCWRKQSGQQEMVVGHMRQPGKRAITLSRGVEVGYSGVVAGLTQKKANTGDNTHQTAAAVTAGRLVTRSTGSAAGSCCNPCCSSTPAQVSGAWPEKGGCVLRQQ